MSMSFNIVNVFLLFINLFINQIGFGESKWKIKAELDLETIHHTIEMNHPGLLDQENPSFRSQLEESYAQAKRDLSLVETYDAYFGILSQYLSVFEDTHLKIVPFSLENSKMRWPGIVLAHRNGKTFVSYKHHNYGASLPKEGSILLSCDGKSVEDLFSQNVTPLRLKRKYEYRQKISDLFLQEGDMPFAETIKKCTFKHGKFKPRNFDLVWKNINFYERTSHQILDAIRQAKDYFAPEIDFRLLQKNQGYWISVPTFRIEDSIELSALFATLQKNRKEISSSKNIVIDVRGNDGGQWENGKLLIKAIWGKKAYDEASSTSGELTKIWRVSTTNLAQYKKTILPDTEKAYGKESAIYKRRVKELNSFEDAIMKGEELLEILNEKLDVVDTEEQVPGPERVFLLTDGACVSSCLLFVDLVKTIPGLVHVGLPTSSDTKYVEVFKQSLPSGLSFLVYPPAMLVGRNRKNHEPYIPTYEWQGENSDTNGIENWILEIAKSIDQSKASDRSTDEL